MWENLKSILKDNKTRCVIVEDGEPRYVIMTFQEYQHLQCVKNYDKVDVNGELQEAAGAGDKYASSINIEDLPF